MLLCESVGLLTPDGDVYIEEITLEVHALVKDGVEMVYCRSVQTALVAEFVRKLAKQDEPTAAEDDDVRTLSTIFTQSG